MRGVTPQEYIESENDNISTHTPHARRDTILRHLIYFYKISTHTPHARRDHHIHHPYILTIISTHTPHARRDIF